MVYLYRDFLGLTIDLELNDLFHIQDPELSSVTLVQLHTHSG